jgi:2-succinyl-5-enolpyruvyl-6-hydroxy-3-cyclohexene-1-carboxylate synthase
LVIGDLALLHDLNALALLKAQPVVIVALNNDGGGIFHFLPIAAHDEVFEPYFATPHDRSFEHAAALFDLAYARPDTVRAFTEAYRTACRQARSTLIEVKTDRAENRTLHDDLEQRMARAVTATY